MSGNPILIALALGGMFAGHTALSAQLMGDDKTANDARSVSMLFGFGEMGVSMLSRGGQKVAEGASRHLLQRTKDATHRLGEAAEGASRHLLQRSKDATHRLGNLSERTMKALEKPFAALPKANANANANAAPLTQRTMSALLNNVPDLPHAYIINWNLRQPPRGPFFSQNIALPEIGQKSLKIRKT